MDKDPNRGQADYEITQFLLRDCGRLGEIIDAKADELRWRIKERSPHAPLSKAGAVEAVIKALMFVERIPKYNA